MDKKEKVLRGLAICADEDSSCADCPYFGEGCQDDLIKDCEKIFFRNEKPAPAAPELNAWISVEDRLPDEEFRKWVKDCTDNDPDINEIEALEVIVLIKGASAATTLFYCDGDFFDGDANLYNVTHWMPLPEPPKGK